MNDPIDREPFDDPQTGAIIGAGYDAHFKMGRGFSEAVYVECLTVEFSRRGIPFVREAALPVTYDGILLPVRFRADFICYDSVLVEVKALPAITGKEFAQALNYVRAAKVERGLLLNFGAPKFEHRRVVWQLGKDPARVAGVMASPNGHALLAREETPRPES